MRSLSVVVFFVFSSLCMAGSNHQQQVHHVDHRQEEGQDNRGTSTQEIHMHGLAALTLAVEGDLLEIEFDSPAANIVGFEHRARSTQQIAAVEKAQAVLESSEQVFRFQGGGCSVEQVRVDLTALVSQDEHSEHEGHHSAETGHSEIRASYLYRCQQPATLKSVAVYLLKVFSGIETLKAHWVNATGQGTADITAQSNRIIIE